MVILLIINAFSFNAIIALDKNFNNVWVEKANFEQGLHEYEKVLYRLLFSF